MHSRLVALLALACAPRVPPDDSLPLGADMAACFTPLVTALSDDRMQGRGVGGPGIDRAAKLLRERLTQAGLVAAAPEGLQRFDAPTGVSVGASTRLDAGEGPLDVGRDLMPFAFSSNGAFEGDVVFAGYGIQAPDLDYDDYAGLDVQGKVVLAMRYEPGEDDPDSRFEGRRPTRWSDLRQKALTARNLGAAALVLVSPSQDADEPDKVPPLASRGPVSRAGLPVLQVTRQVADRWLAKGGTDLATLRAEIDAATAPRSRALPGARATGEVQLDTTTAEAANVVFEIPGRGALADEVVVVGAHYDHLGLGGDGSMVPGVTAIHNGADDNASGTAAVTCAAAALRRELPDRDRRTLVVALFSAEEMGLLGSGWYVNHPVFPLERTVAMVNLDMVGDLWDEPLQALGTDSSTSWPELLEGTLGASGLSLTMGGDGYGPSDHMSFYEREVPVVHLFTGAHDRYHTPDDDVAALDLAGGVKIATGLTRLLDTLITTDAPLQYVRTSSGPAMAGDSRGFGAWLGTIPDYSAMSATEGGVKLSDVRPGGPADRGGIRGGDVIVGMAGMEIQNLYDMTFALRDHKPGETVDVVVLRDGERLTLKATLGDRAKMVTEPGGPHGGGAPAPAATPSCADVPSAASMKPGSWPQTPGKAWKPGAGEPVPGQLHPDERHLADLRQLTFGGENAEAYWFPDGRHLIFQRTPPEGGCDQQFVMDLDSGEVTLVSSGEGRTTCGYTTWPEASEILYATTEATSAECPPPPDMSQGYVWPVYDSFDLVRHPVGGEPQVFASRDDAYDAEATVSMADGRVVFTSTRDGDLDLYILEPGKDEPCRLTDTPGYDGGAFFTSDGSWIVFRASRPEGDALADYRRLLGQGLVRPGALELYRIRPDGSGLTQLTDNGAANFGPYAHPSNDFVIFSSNVGGDPRAFDLWTVPWEGGEVSRVTHTEGFDGFPMFSPDGRWLVFASNRADPKARDTNLYLARWVP